jgi:hypothetical protein
MLDFYYKGGIAELAPKKVESIAYSLISTELDEALLLGSIPSLTCSIV